MTPFGVILAGGKATRMGGGDKGMRPLQGRRVIDHVIDRLQPQVGRLALNANGDATRFDGLGLPILPDSLPDHPGPLAGVLAGLNWAHAQGASHIVTAAADTPFFPLNLVDVLRSEGGAQGFALAATRDGTGKLWRQPTFGLWPVALRDNLQDALVGGLRKIVLWTDQHNAGTAVFDGIENDPFFNINTPEDMKIAERMVPSR